MTELVAQAGLRIDYGVLFDNSSIAIESPVRIRYADSSHGFDLPPSRFAWFPQRAGIVTGIESTPVLTYVDLQKAHEIAIEMQRLLGQAGWTAVATFPNEFDSVKRVFDRQREDGTSRLYGKWQLGTVTAEIYVKRHADTAARLAGRTPAELYLPTIDIMDWMLLKSLDDKVFGLRRRVSGSIDKSLPLAAWIKE